MNINEVKQLNKDCIAIQGRYEILKIKQAMGVDCNSEIFNVSGSRNDFITKLNEQKDNFNVVYKEVRDALFRDLKKRNMQAVGFACRIGDDGKDAYYACGLYDLGKAKSKGYSALEAAQAGYGVVIGIVVQPMDKPKNMIESEVYGDIINVFDAKSHYGVTPLTIRSYKNFKEQNGYYDEILWNAVSKNFEDVKESEVEVEDEKKEYQSTLHILDKCYVRPYTEIGYFNEAKPYVPKNDDLTK